MKTIWFKKTTLDSSRAFPLVNALCYRLKKARRYPLFLLVHRTPLFCVMTSLVRETKPASSSSYSTMSDVTGSSSSKSSSYSSSPTSTIVSTPVPPPADKSGVNNTVCAWYRGCVPDAHTDGLLFSSECSAVCMHETDEAKRQAHCNTCLYEATNNETPEGRNKRVEQLVALFNQSKEAKEQLKQAKTTWKRQLLERKGTGIQWPQVNAPFAVFGCLQSKLLMFRCEPDTTTPTWATAMQKAANAGLNYLEWSIPRKCVEEVLHAHTNVDQRYQLMPIKIELVNHSLDFPTAFHVHLCSQRVQADVIGDNTNPKRIRTWTNRTDVSDPCEFDGERGISSVISRNTPPLVTTLYTNPDYICQRITASRWAETDFDAIYNEANVEGDSDKTVNAQLVEADGVHAKSPLAFFVVSKYFKDNEWSEARTNDFASLNNEGPGTQTVLHNGEVAKELKKFHSTLGFDDYLLSLNGGLSVRLHPVGMGFERMLQEMKATVYGVPHAIVQDTAPITDFTDAMYRPFHSLYSANLTLKITYRPILRQEKGDFPFQPANLAAEKLS